MLGCYRVFRDYDASMLEINPLVVTRDGNLVALDAKMSFDENALFRRPEISELRDKSQEDPRETFASDRGLVLCRPRRQYRLHHQRRRPRHGDDGHDQDRRRRTGELPRHRRRRFARARGQVVPRGARATRMSRRSSSTSSPASTAATGWPRACIKAIREVGVKVPLVVRLAGTNVEEGRRILAESGDAIIVADTLAEAADKAVAAMARGHHEESKLREEEHGNSAQPEDPRHRPGLHRQDRQLSRRGHETLRHQRGRRRHARQGRPDASRASRYSTR